MGLTAEKKRRDISEKRREPVFFFSSPPIEGFLSVVRLFSISFFLYLSIFLCARDLHLEDIRDGVYHLSDDTGIVLGE
jgi:hypothetical protein